MAKTNRIHLRPRNKIGISRRAGKLTDGRAIGRQSDIGPPSQSVQLETRLTYKLYKNTQNKYDILCLSAKHGRVLRPNSDFYDHHIFFTLFFWIVRHSIHSIILKEITL